MFDKTAVVLLVRIVSSLHGGIWHELKLKLRYENQFDYEPSQFYLKKNKQKSLIRRGLKWLFNHYIMLSFVVVA